MKQELFTRDFTLVVIGQVVSLFGNAAIRFALPLYLLNQTGSAALHGAVTACAFIPAVLLSPVGGIIADRVNKRNIMVALDFFTAAVILIFTLLLAKMDLVVLLTATLMVLYGIAGAYQPSVQASIPALVGRDHFVAANSAVSMVSSLASLLGPALGGMLYSAWGLRPVLWVCMGCFFASAVMELFIRIPFERPAYTEGVLKSVRRDFAQSIRFIQKDCPLIGKGVVYLCGINLFLSAMIIVGVPYLTTEILALDPAWANALCGFAQAGLAAGGLTGGICAAVFWKKLAVKKAGILLVAAALCALPLGISLALVSSGIVNYIIMAVCCFTIMVFSNIFTVFMMSYVQAETPRQFLGQVTAVILTLCMCAQPVGSALYGVLFEACAGKEFLVVQLAGVVSLLIALRAGRVFNRI